MPVSSGRVDRRSRLKSKLLDSPGWVSASGNLFTTPQSGFKKNNRRSTLFPDNLSPRRTRRQTIVMNVPLVDLCEDASPETSNASQAAPSKRKEHSAVNGTSEVQVELMKAPSKRTARSSAKPKSSKSSSKSSKALPPVEEQPSNSRRQRGRTLKSGTKRTAKKKDKENVEEEELSESHEENGGSQIHNECELPSLESEDFEDSSARTRSRRKKRTVAELTATPMLLLNRVDTNHQSKKMAKSLTLQSTPTASPTKDNDSVEILLNDSKLADASISSLNASQVANTSGRCYIL